MSASVSPVFYSMLSTVRSSQHYRGLVLALGPFRRIRTKNAIHTMKAMMLVITSIDYPRHPVLGQYALEAQQSNIPFIVTGDTKNSTNMV